MRIPGYTDAIAHVAHDTQSALAAGTTLLTFFKQPNQAQGASNMRSDGRFSSPQAFYIQSVSLAVPMATAPADVQLLYNATATLTLYAGKTWYIDHWSLNNFPISIGLNGFGGAAAATLFAGAGAGVSGKKIYPDIPISTDEQFYVELRWGTAPGIAADVPIQILLAGLLDRSVQ